MPYISVIVSILSTQLAYTHSWYFQLGTILFQLALLRSDTSESTIIQKPCIITPLDHITVPVRSARSSSESITSSDYIWIPEAPRYTCPADPFLDIRLPYPVLKTQDFLNLLYNFLFDMLCIYQTLLHTSLSLLYIKALTASLKNNKLHPSFQFTVRVTVSIAIQPSLLRFPLHLWPHCDFLCCLYCNILALFSIATFSTDSIATFPHDSPSRYILAPDCFYRVIDITSWQY